MKLTNRLILPGDKEPSYFWRDMLGILLLVVGFGAAAFLFLGISPVL